MLVTLHGYDINLHPEWWETGRGGRRRCNYPRQLLRLAREPKVRFIAVSRAICQRAIDYGIPADNITVNYIGVDTNTFKPGPIPISKRSKRILFVGRLVEKKGTAYLIRAFAGVRKKIPDAKLVIVGDGPLRSSLRALAASLNVPVDFLGALSSDQIRDQMDQARAFCLPSITATNGDAEGLPIAILEAQSSGLPVVTSARGGVGEAVINGLTGSAVKEAAIDSLEEALHLLLSNGQLAEALGKRGRDQAVEQFDLYRSSEHLETLYSKSAHS
jgi:glycosyltransferase involved in cell wall biosynthesis